MVGTTRFELATSPTPRVRSTRLSHVPTIVGTSAQGATAGYVAVLSVHDPVSDNQLRCRRHKLLWQRTTFSKKELVHLFNQKLLRFARPRL
jgi:hypothetical protein